ncbi:hypothetical protein CH313_29000 [Streptomyces sp. TSRI0384-2]|nr:hypothetical protein CH313_29000 [Streptomyces sp. TSRI0384-2]
MRGSGSGEGGAGCWVLGAGCWVLGAGCWVLGAGCRQIFVRGGGCAWAWAWRRGAWAGGRLPGKERRRAAGVPGGGDDFGGNG